MGPKRSSPAGKAGICECKFTHNMTISKKFFYFAEAVWLLVSWLLVLTGGDKGKLPMTRETGKAVVGCWFSRDE